jgi:hypothetical protein
MLESTIPTNVVGICIKSIPLLNVEATNPVKSPITPPPNTLTLLASLSFFASFLYCLNDLLFSPAGITTTLLSSNSWR